MKGELPFKSLSGNSLGLFWGDFDACAVEVGYGERPFPGRVSAGWRSNGDDSSPAKGINTLKG